MKKLGDIVEYNIGGTPSRKEDKYWGGDNLWVSVGELNGGIIQDTKEKITNEGIEKSSVKEIETGSILMSFKLSIGKMGIAGKTMYCNEAIVFFKHENDTTNKYLYNWLKYNDVSCYASGQIGIGSLNKTSLGEIPIPIPSLEVQADIVKQINEINNKTSHFEVYAQCLQTQLDKITEIIQNMTTAKKVIEELEPDEQEETPEPVTAPDPVSEKPKKKTRVIKKGKVPKPEPDPDTVSVDSTSSKPGLGLGDFPCATCGKGFKTKSGLGSHTKAGKCVAVVEPVVEPVIAQAETPVIKVEPKKSGKVRVKAKTLSPGN